MGNETIRGKISNTQNATELRYTPTDGWSGQWQVEGPKAAVIPLLNQLAAQGYSLAYRCDQSPKASLVYSNQGSPDGGVTPEQPTLVWEYFANVAEIDVLEVDTAAISGISDADKRKIREGIATPDPDNAPDLTGNALTLYQLMLGGVRSFRINIPTLRVSKLVSGSYGVKASLTNVGRIISTSTLSIQEAIPATILFELPSFVSGKSGFAYAWYKKFPNVQQAGTFKWSISQEWEYGLWPTFMYSAVL